jgi:predicted polyphosphate/ATP-dependent NAD kinase
MKRLGLIINPIAGMGGTVGLKGTDGFELLLRAEQLGAIPQAHKRAEQALTALSTLSEDLELLTYKDSMGQAAALSAGLNPQAIGSGSSPRTTPDDTAEAARRMAAQAVDLLLFAGGDGTARDVCAAVGTSLTVLGIPAGVKIQSAAFATSPTVAGQIAKSYLVGGIGCAREVEVMDINEEDYRNEILSARLYGYLRIPDAGPRTQGAKAASSPSEHVMQQAIAVEVAERMIDDRCYIVGPGTTCRAISEALGLDGSLLGVDVIRQRRLVGKDLSEHEILSRITGNASALILTPIGGQGFLLGRGNQQISPAVIKQVGKENVVVVATGEKLASLQGRPLLVDTGDSELDAYLAGYYRVATGYRETAVYRVES